MSTTNNLNNKEPPTKPNNADEMVHSNKKDENKDDELTEEDVAEVRL